MTVPVEAGASGKGYDALFPPGLLCEETAPVADASAAR